ncbi:hypothetical protein [uncultured Sphingomonas sp.]|uniref:hypothetical protein n=1 Tax=uncultured Sphingomonas sp. TaxID=158754 RepID=UPI0035CC4059
MKMIALLGAAALTVGGVAATPAAAQYHHGDHRGYRGGYGHHGGGYRGDYGYRHGGYRGGWHGYRHHRVVCNRFGRCHRI